MAVRREFSSEKQSRKLKEIKTQNQDDPTPESIDALVSSFLAELTD